MFEKYQLAVELVVIIGGIIACGFCLYYGIREILK